MGKINLRSKKHYLDSFSKSIFENSPSAIIIFEVIGSGNQGKDYIIRDVNPKCVEIENWENIDVIDKPLSEIRPGVDEYGIIKAFKKVYETGEPTNYPAKIYKGENVYKWFENNIYKLPTGEVVSVYSDVTEKIRAQEELFAEKERLSTTLYAIGDGVIGINSQGIIETVNDAALKLTGWSLDEALDRPLEKIYRIQRQENDIILNTKNNEKKIITESSSPIRNRQGETIGQVLAFSDITEAKEREKRIKFLSFHDPLTGLNNRTFFEETLKDMGKNSSQHATVVVGDLDGLKLINDIFGHHIGDKVLKRIADIFREACKDTHLISRWGGDEFIILMPETTEKEGHKICRYIKKKCEEAAIPEAKDISISISLGCAEQSDKEGNWRDLIKRAEDNMYKSKLLESHSYRNIILTSMKKALFEKSCETEEHGNRMGMHCEKIGEIMGFSAMEIDDLKLLAMLHDIGKIAVDDNILNKPDKLTPDEEEIMRRHPESGFRIARTVPELTGIAEYILSHHEWWNGQGYPRGLAGKDIPKPSRILSVVDAFDAITTDRPYRPARSREFAKEELIRCAGSQFDPEIVDIFIKFLEEEEE